MQKPRRSFFNVTEAVNYYANHRGQCFYSLKKFIEPTEISKRKLLHSKTLLAQNDFFATCKRAHFLTGGNGYGNVASDKKRMIFQRKFSSSGAILLRRFSDNSDKDAFNLAQIY